MPRGVEHASKVSQTKAARSLIQTSKVEQDIGLHWRVEVEATYAGSLVEEVCTGNLAIGTLLCGIADDELNHVHLLDDVLEGADVGVGNLAPNRDVAKRGQVLEEVVGELVTGSLAYYALEVLWLNEAILVLVEMREALTHSLALQTPQQLGELGIGHRVSVLLGADV